MNAKVHINLSQGILEVEGEPDFVRGIYDDFKLELTKLAAQNKLPTNDNPQLTHSVSTDIISIEAQQPAEQNSGAEKKKTKRSINRPPKGHSCADRIGTLRSKGFFKTQKSPNEIIQGLAKEGWTHNYNQVTAAAISMFNRGDIQRTNVGNGFAYFWDRD